MQRQVEVFYLQAAVGRWVVSHVIQQPLQCYLNPETPLQESSRMPEGWEGLRVILQKGKFEESGDAQPREG